VSWQEYRNNLLNDPALIAYYDFQEGQGEVLGNRAKSGSVLDGVIHKGQWVDGRWQGKHALNFDGGGTYVEIPHNALLHPFGKEPGEGEITIEVWVKVTAANESGIVDKYSEGWGKNATYAIWISVKKLMAAFGGDGTTGQSVKDTVEVSLDDWQHLVLTVSPEKLAFYKNGMKVVETARTLVPLDNGKPLLVGCMKPGLYYFKGVIDEIAIYKRALADTEIKNHYDTGQQVSKKGNVEAFETLAGEIGALKEKVREPEIAEKLADLHEKMKDALLRYSGIPADRAGSGEALKITGEMESIQKEFSENLMWKARLSVLISEIY